MEPLEPCRRMGSHGRLLDASLLRALLLPGPGGAAALDWLERVGEGLLRVSAWSVMEFEGELAGQAAQCMLDGFLAERCPVVCFEPDDFAMVRHRLADRLGLLPVTLDRDLAEAAGALSYPVDTPEPPETPCFTSRAWGAASRKPSCS